MWVHSLSAYSHECQIISGSVALILDSRSSLLDPWLPTGAVNKICVCPPKSNGKKISEGGIFGGVIYAEETKGKGADERPNGAPVVVDQNQCAPRNCESIAKSPKKKQKKKTENEKLERATFSFGFIYNFSFRARCRCRSGGYNDTTVSTRRRQFQLQIQTVAQSLSFQVDQRQCPGAAIPIWWSAVFQLTASGIARVPVVYPISLIYTDIPDSRSAVANTMRLPIGAAMKTTLFFLATATATATLTGQQGVTLDKKKHLVISIECV